MKLLIQSVMIFFGTLLAAGVVKKIMTDWINSFMARFRTDALPVSTECAR